MDVDFFVQLLRSIPFFVVSLFILLALWDS